MFARNGMLSTMIALLVTIFSSIWLPLVTGTTTAPPATTTTKPPVFVHYYLWWDASHWVSKLGTAYPLAQQPAPLPATLAADGCAATALYPGGGLIDVPRALYSQDEAATFDQHILAAASAGINGFVVAWAGAGTANQTASSTRYNQRLDLLAQRVAAYNSTHATPFSLMIGYQSLTDSRVARALSWVKNDWAYIARSYGAQAAFHVPQYGARPVLVMLNSRKFAVDQIADAAATFGAALLLVGDEHGLADWNRGVSASFEGNSWYWASENPETNPGAADTLAQLAATLHAQGKLWFAPLSAGFNRQNFGLGGICVPREQGAMLKKIYATNNGSQPNGWMYISWNEFVENTYLEPSVRYGTTYLDTLAALIRQR